MKLFCVTGTPGRLWHILQLLLWQSVLGYWVGSTLLCLSHVNDQDTKEAAQAAPAPPLLCWGLSPLTCAIYTAWEGSPTPENLTPWVLRTSLWRHLWDLHLFQNQFCRGKTTQWQSPFLYFKARIFLWRFCVLLQTADLV